MRLLPGANRDWAAVVVGPTALPAAGTLVLQPPTPLVAKEYATASRNGRPLRSHG
jgi:hypothetical protein